MPQADDRHLRQVLDDFLKCRAAGEPVDTSELIKSNADLMPELGEHLKRLERIEQARAQALRHELTAGGLSVLEMCTVTEIPEPAAWASETVAVTPNKPPAHAPTIDGYEISSVLGQGGMGIVYRAEQTKLKRTVALKVLPAMVGAANPSTISRFRREATAAARLHHTNIIPIYDFGQSRDTYYYAMELVNGQSLDMVVSRLSELDAPSASPARLAQLIHMVASPEVEVDAELQAVSSPGSGSGSASTVTSHGRPYYSQVARWMADAADALHFAHSEGVIHRDIKPANLILSVDGRIMLADFGLAKCVDDQSVTMTGLLLGTLRYVSPEQAMAKRMRLDHRTDIYSLGATMYELLTFQPAFSGVDDKEILGAIITRDPTAPRKIQSVIPHELEIICLKMMEKSPEKRYQSAAELAADLRRYLNDLPIAARRPSPFARAQKFVRRHRAATIAAIMVAILGVTLPLFFRAEAKWRVAEQKREQAEASQLEAEVDMLISQGVALWGRKKHLLAAEKLKQAISIDPSSFEAVGTLAYINLELYNQDPEIGEHFLVEAQKFCETALEVNPDHAATWNIVASLAKNLKDYDKAEEAIRRAIDLRPSDSLYAYWSNLSLILTLQGKFQDAEEAFRGSLDTFVASDSRDCPSLTRNFAVLQIYQDKAESLSVIETAIKCNHSDVRARLIRALGHLQLSAAHDIEKALADASFADEFANGEDPLAKRLRAFAHLRNGQFAEAAMHAQQATELGDLPAFGYLIMGIAAAKQGDERTARSNLQLALKSWPKDLTNATDHRIEAPGGQLWIESGRVLQDLETELQELLAGLPREP